MSLAFESQFPMNPLGTQQVWEGIVDASEKAGLLRTVAWAKARAARSEIRFGAAACPLTDLASRAERASAMDDLVRIRLMTMDASPLSSAAHKLALLARISDCIWEFSNAETRTALAAGTRGSHMTLALDAISADVERMLDGPGPCQRH